MAGEKKSGTWGCSFASKGVFGNQFSFKCMKVNGVSLQIKYNRYYPGEQ